MAQNLSKKRRMEEEYLLPSSAGRRNMGAEGGSVRVAMRPRTNRLDNRGLVCQLTAVYKEGQLLPPLTRRWVMALGAGAPVGVRARRCWAGDVSGGSAIGITLLFLGLKVFLIVLISHLILIVDANRVVRRRPITTPRAPCC